jgi:hypothetical protein
MAGEVLPQSVADLAAVPGAEAPKRAIELTRFSARSLVSCRRA